jgi:hypothetical protein
VQRVAQILDSEVLAGLLAGTEHWHRPTLGQPLDGGGDQLRRALGQDGAK